MSVAKVLHDERVRWIVRHLEQSLTREFDPSCFAGKDNRIFKGRSSIELYMGSIRQGHLHPLPGRDENRHLTLCQRVMVDNLSQVGGSDHHNHGSRRTNRISCNPKKGCGEASAGQCQMQEPVHKGPTPRKGGVLSGIPPGWPERLPPRRGYVLPPLERFRPRKYLNKSSCSMCSQS